jgi:hypothetical protein
MESGILMKNMKNRVSLFSNAAELMALPEVGHGFSVRANWLPQFKQILYQLA